MRIKKFLITAALTTMLAGTLSSCGKVSKVITVWVGEESSQFYQTVCDEYIAEHPEFGYSVQVKGVDTGTTGGAMSDDNTKCGDIITVAHDNIGKLVEKNKVLPFVGEDIIAQVEADNPESFKKVVYMKNDIGEGMKSYLYGVPYISQALFLYYNKAKVSEAQAKTFEGLMAAAKANNTKAFGITGADAFNYSFNLLARNAEDNTTTLRLYENFSRKDCYAQGEDEVASLKWAQRVFNDPNGGLLPTDSGWATELKDSKILSVVGGAWHYSAVKGALGESNMGIAVLPTYELTSKDVEDTEMASGTKMQAGTFADCKVFMINFKTNGEKYSKAQELVKHLSQKSMQLRSFKECLNVPAYQGCDQDIEAIKSEVSATEYALAKAQLEMSKYGIAQPFNSGTLNTFFYSKKADEEYKNAIINDKGAYNTTRKIRETLYTMEYIWQKGTKPSEIPSELPTDVI